MVLVSVIMGSYNHERYIGEAIESILNQTCKDLELIIVDDASKDSSKEIIKQYQFKDSRIQALFHEKNMGIPRTINDCLDRVKGKFVCLIDSDDIWEPHKLESQLAVLGRNEGKLVWSEGSVIDANGELTGETITKLLYSQKKSGNLFEELLREQFVLFQSLIFETRFISDIRRDERLKYVSDHLFIVELSRTHEFVFMNEPLARYRVHGGNVTHHDVKGWMNERITIRKLFLRQYSEIISNVTKADIYHKIGHAYSLLGEAKVAQYYYMQAFLANYLQRISALYLTLALTARNDAINGLTAKLYYSISSILADRFGKRRVSA